MKNRVLLSVLVFVLLPTTSFSQIEFGAKAGVNFATISSDAITEPLYRTGFTAGAQLLALVSDSWFVQPEANFVMKGFSTELRISGVVERSSVRLNYVEVPILLGYAAQEDSRLFIGPYFNYFLNGTGRFTLDGVADGVPLDTVEQEDVDRDRLKVPAFGLVIGAALTMERILFDFRYAQGLSNANSDNSRTDFRNRSVQITSGFVF